MRKSKGITLIALVITIVILLILAAISLNAILGENGILARAQKSRMETQIAKEKEQIEIAYNTLKTNKLIDGEDIDSEKFKNELEKNGNSIKSVAEEPDGFLIIFADTENEHKINPDTGEVGFQA